MKTLRDLLNMAIAQEIASQKLYTRGLDLTEDKEVKALLRKLIEEEVTHQTVLEGIRDSEMYDPAIIIEDESVFMNAKISHGDNDEDMDESMNIDQLFDQALKREYNAFKTFQLAAEAVDNDELKTLLTNLAKEEESHHFNVDKQYKLSQGEMGRED